MNARQVSSWDLPGVFCLLPIGVFGNIRIAEYGNGQIKCAKEHKGKSVSRTNAIHRVRPTLSAFSSLPVVPEK
jgi:hypothetical protein